MFDTADVLTAITAAVAAIGVIGAAVLGGPRVAIAGWGWLKRVLR